MYSAYHPLDRKRDPVKSQKNLMFCCDAAQEIEKQLFPPARHCQIGANKMQDNLGIANVYRESP